MTALKQFERLESPGLWRESPQAQRRDVILTFGDASLVIADSQARPLTHWSLAALSRLNPGALPALYSPDPDSGETLELDDALMIEAIETVRAAISRARPHRGRLRLLALGGSLAAVLSLGLFWMPGALVRHTAAVVPAPARAEIGAALLAQITRVSGPPCREAGGRQALARLSARLPGRGRTVVLPAGIAQAAHLPGGLVLLNRALVEDYDGPEVAAGFILAERARAAEADPLQSLLRAVGLRATLRLLTTGALPDSALRAYAEELPGAPPRPLTDETLLARFAEAGVPSSPYAYALDISGETVLPLIEADPMRGRTQEPVLGDGDWVRLQGICGD
ncbi:hypothetical protein [Actibacterium sp. MT2.3-13A]|uniref:hypothetical protein n=1 Tax=Actibacterium sp. MT2.3-13A TaxID=2828332 RepID=UPI001BA7943E|nr:hypothetical protein [Actibacterium sp. MT2.3-13A]